MVVNLPKSRRFGSRRISSDGGESGVCWYAKPTGHANQTETRNVAAFPAFLTLTLTLSHLPREVPEAVSLLISVRQRLALATQCMSQGRCTIAILQEKNNLNRIAYLQGLGGLCEYLSARYWRRRTQLGRMLVHITVWLLRSAALVTAIPLLLRGVVRLWHQGMDLLSIWRTAGPALASHIRVSRN